MSPSDHYAQPSPRVERSPSFLLLLLVVLLILGIASLLWLQLIHTSLTPDPHISLAVTGFGTPTYHRLNPRFQDAGGNLVADPPADPAQLVDPPTLRFAFIEEDDAAKQKAAWQPFMQYLSQVTGKPVQYQLLVGANDMLKCMRDGQLDVAGFNTGSVPTAVNLCGFVPVCAIPTADGTGLTRTVIIVPPNSSIQAAADLRGHELTLTEPGSNSGYKAPLLILRSDFGLEPFSDVQLRYSGSHESSIAGIASGEYQAAAVAEDMLTRQISVGKILPSQYRVIYSSESFPTAGLGYVYNLKPELAAKIRRALLTFDWKGTSLEPLLSGTKQTRFVPISYKNDFALIRRIDDEMGIEEAIH